MTYKNGEEEENKLIVCISIEWDDDEYQLSALDIAAYSFVNTLHWYVKGFATLFFIGLISNKF